ncbi:hypothetical protein [Streptomyces cyaneofuscatus]|uniref:hypothetical protein n=1 Tax=Streptomyces TaxID=1883 RepID=UPI0033AF24C1
MAGGRAVRARGGRGPGADAGVPADVPGFGEFSPADAFARQAELITPLFDGSRSSFERPSEPYHREDLVREIDRLSLRDKLDQVHYSADDELFISNALGGLTGSAAAVT